MSEPFDLIILGGGIVGACVAALAARLRPEWRCLLVERSLPGSGSSAHSAGLATSLASDATRPLVARSTALFEGFRQALPDLPVRPISVCFVCPAPELTHLESRLGGVPLCPVAEDVVAEAGIDRPWMFADGERLVGTADAQVGDVAGVVSRLLRAARAGGAFQFWEGAEAEGCVPLPDGLQEVTMADGRRLEARRVVFAVGPWVLRSPLAAWAITRRVRLKKVVALLIDGAPPSDSPAFYLPHREAFLLPLRESGWLFSFRCEEWDCQPEVSSLRITPADRGAGLAILRTVFPALANRCIGGRVFCDAYTPDGVPLVASVDGLPGCVAVTGTSGSGYKLAPALAERALGLLMDLP